MRRKGSECTRRISPAETSSGAKPVVMMISPASASRRTRAPPEQREQHRPQRQVRGVCGSRLFRSARWTAARFYRRVVMAFRSASNRRTSPNNPAASPDRTPARNSSRRHQQQQQQSAAPPPVVDDSHKSEAVEECIKFMNSSSRKYR